MWIVSYHFLKFSGVIALGSVILEFTHRRPFGAIVTCVLGVEVRFSKLQNWGYVRWWRFVVIYGAEVYRNTKFVWICSGIKASTWSLVGVVIGWRPWTESDTFVYNVTPEKRYTMPNFKNWCLAVLYNFMKNPNNISAAKWYKFPGVVGCTKENPWLFESQEYVTTSDEEHRK